MCAGALVLARVARLVFGAWDPKAGAAGSVRDAVRDTRLNHRVEVVGGVLEEESAALLRSFFDRLDRTSRTCATGAADTRRFGARDADPVRSSAVACPSGLRSTPRKRVRGQLLRGFKSHRHRSCPWP